MWGEGDGEEHWRVFKTGFVLEGENNSTSSGFMVLKQQASRRFLQLLGDFEFWCFRLFLVILFNFDVEMMLGCVLDNGGKICCETILAK